MDHNVVRRRIFTLAAMSAAVIFTACQDKRVKQLSLGITRDSAMSILAQNLKGGGHDAFPNVYTRAAYLTNGKYYEVLYYTPDNDKIGPVTRKPGDTTHADSVPWKKLTPLVFFENKLVGKDWTTWDSISKSLNVPVQNHDK